MSSRASPQSPQQNSTGKAPVATTGTTTQQRQQPPQYGVLQLSLPNYASFNYGPGIRPPMQPTLAGVNPLLQPAPRQLSLSPSVLVPSPTTTVQANPMPNHNIVQDEPTGSKLRRLRTEGAPATLPGLPDISNRDPSTAPRTATQQGTTARSEKASKELSFNAPPFNPKVEKPIWLKEVEKPAAQASWFLRLHRSPSLLEMLHQFPSSTQVIQWCKATSNAVDFLRLSSATLPMFKAMAELDLLPQVRTVGSQAREPPSAGPISSNEPNHVALPVSGTQVLEGHEANPRIQDPTDHFTLSGTVLGLAVGESISILRNDVEASPTTQQYFTSLVPRHAVAALVASLQLLILETQNGRFSPRNSQHCLSYGVFCTRTGLSTYTIGLLTPLTETDDRLMTLLNTWRSGFSAGYGQQLATDQLYRSPGTSLLCNLNRSPHKLTLFWDQWDGRITPLTIIPALKVTVSTHRLTPVSADAPPQQDSSQLSPSFWQMFESIEVFLARPNGARLFGTTQVAWDSPITNNTSPGSPLSNALHWKWTGSFFEVKLPANNFDATFQTKPTHYPDESDNFTLVFDDLYVDQAGECMLMVTATVRPLYAPFQPSLLTALAPFLVVES